MQGVQKQSTDLAKYILEDLLSRAPEAEIEEKLSPTLRSQLTELQNKLDEVEAARRLEREASQQRLDDLKLEKESLDAEIARIRSDLGKASATLLAAAVRDVGWLHAVRTQLMPKEPGRAPFHNDAEIASRGYHCSNVRGAPVLTSVTWSKLDYIENKRHRGYRAGVIFRGSGFAPGITYATRKVGEGSPPNGRTDYWWRLPNIYFGDYLEVAAMDNEVDSPLDYRNTEFCVRNPEGQTSEWIRFSYAFDEPRLREIMAQQQELGERLYNEWRFAEAVEPLRRAMVFSDRLDGSEHERTKHITALWNNALDGRTLSGCRFREADWIRVVRGEHAGVVAVIESLGRRHAKPYFFRTQGSEPGWRGLKGASDDEVEAAEPASAKSDLSSPGSDHTNAEASDGSGTA